MMKNKIFGVKKVRIRKGDKVVVINGKDKGKSGLVKFVFTKTNLIVVDGVNKFKKALKIGNGNNEHFVEKERPMSISKVKVIEKKQIEKKQKKNKVAKQKNNKNNFLKVVKS